MNRLKHLRSMKNITLRDLSEKVNISYVTLSRYENNIQQMTDENLIALSKFFDVSTDYLLGLSNIKKPELKEVLKDDDFQFALYNKTKDLSDDAKEDLLGIAEFYRKKEEK